jgi:SAM-dependent methyltransferase
MSHNSTQRFSSRVDNYVKYRPGYPPDVVRTLTSEHGLTPASLVADVGSGTGIFTAVFLANGNEVWGVEPNREMREAGERFLAHFPRFHSVEGTAEATTLADASVDLVTVGQAFHWFDRDRAKVEFKRILRPGGWIAMAWNDRRLATRPFLDAYEKLLATYGTDYKVVAHEHGGDDGVSLFFEGGELRSYVFESFQTFDYEGLKGRLLSSSYAPEEGHPNHAPMIRELEEIFRAYQQDGKITFDYDTRLFVGRLP